MSDASEEAKNSSSFAREEDIGVSKGTVGKRIGHSLTIIGIQDSVILPEFSSGIPESEATRRPPFDAEQEFASFCDSKKIRSLDSFFKAVDDANWPFVSGRFIRQIGDMCREWIMVQDKDLFLEISKSIFPSAGDTFLHGAGTGTIKDPMVFYDMRVLDFYRRHWLKFREHGDPSRREYYIPYFCVNPIERAAEVELDFSDHKTVIEASNSSQSGFSFDIKLPGFGGSRKVSSEVAFSWKSAGRLDSQLQIQVKLHVLERYFIGDKGLCKLVELSLSPEHTRKTDAPEDILAPIDPREGAGVLASEALRRVQRQLDETKIEVKRTYSDSFSIGFDSLKLPVPMDEKAGAKFTYEVVAKDSFAVSHSVPTGYRYTKYGKNIGCHNIYITAEKL